MESAIVIELGERVILRSILAVLVAVAVVFFYGDKPEVPVACVAMVALGLAGQVLIVHAGNLYPFLRVWMVAFLLAVFFLPLDFAQTDAYDPPTYFSCVMVFLGCLVVGFCSLSEGRSFLGCRTTLPRRDTAKPENARDDSGRLQSPA